MAGIFGYYSRNVNENILNDVMCIMKDEGYCITDSIFNRSCVLGKLDIKSTEVKELITKKEDKISIVTCGEIYNEDIENLDKSILKLYEEGRLDKLKNFNGSFTAAIYDYIEEKLILVNDRYGLIKLFYYHDEDRFCFAPKIRPLLKMGAEKSLRKDAIIDFFLFGYLLGDKTFFEHIHQLPPASILEISKNGMNLTKYWDYEYDEQYDARPQEELIDELGTLWQRAVERRVKKEETIIIPLSGGLDSRAILAAALKCTSRDNIITFTFGEKGSFDFEIGKMVAEKASVRNIPLGVEKEDFEGQYNAFLNDAEGMIDATPYFAIRGYKKMKKYGDRLFSGTMIDVLLGRHTLSHIFSSDMLKKEISSEEDYTKVKKLILENQKLNDEKEILRLFKADFLKNIDIKSSFDKTQKKFVDIDDKKFPNYFAVWDYTNRWNKYIYFAVLCYRNLFKYHTMLDSDLVDFTLKLPPELRLDENLYIQMLMKKYPELFKLPTKKNLGLRLDVGSASLFLRRFILFSKRRANKTSSMLIKRNIFLDKNENYVDYDDLLRGNKEYRDYMRKMIDKAKEREYFNRDYIEEIWRLHIQGRKNYSMLLGLLVTFELFLENFCGDQMKAQNMGEGDTISKFRLNEYNSF